MAILNWWARSGWGSRVSAGLVLWCVAVSGSLVSGSRAAVPEGENAPAVRSFRLVYGATIDQLPVGAKARVWVPVPPTDHEQTVELILARTPSKSQMTREQKFGNPLIFFEAAADEQGTIPIDIEYRITRRELTPATWESVPQEKVELHLQPSHFIPVDGRVLSRLMGDKFVAQVEGLPRARQLYDAVDNLMKYDKPEGKPWGRGDALWACDSHYGNCTDFHSIFIGACRDLKIPAKFEMGFSIPEQRGAGKVTGYHCWAKFLDEGRWVPVDISEADKHLEQKPYYFGNLTADRLKLTEGRDLELVPAPAHGPVNFLVHPYVEVDGEPHKKFTQRCTYQDE